MRFCWLHSYFIVSCSICPLAIFSACDPAMAFLCSVPLNALKDQLKKSLLDDTVDGTDRYQANGSTRSSLVFTASILSIWLFWNFCFHSCW